MSFDTILSLIETYRYWVLLPLALFEGPITAFVVGMLVAFGYFNLFAVYAIMVLGDLIPDVIYFMFGRYGGKKDFIRRQFAKVGIKDEDIEVIRGLWANHGVKTMAFTKLAYGLSTPFLISAGLVGMPLRRFLTYTVSVSLVQYAIFLALGYYFSNSFGTVTNILENMQYLVAAVGVVALGYYFLTRYMRKRLLEEEREAKEELQ